MKDDKIKNLEVEIAALKHDQDWLEQYTRRTSLRISGLPEGNNEDVCAKVLDLCNKKLRIPVEPNEIERVNWLGRPGGSPRQILVKFATYGTRASVFKAKAVLRPGGRHPHAPWTLGDAAGRAQAPDVTEAPSAAEATDNTATNDDDADNDSDTDTDYSKVFISEDLPRDRQFMFWRARRAKKSKKIRDCCSAFDLRIHVWIFTHICVRYNWILIRNHHCQITVLCSIFVIVCLSRLLPYNA